MHEIYNIHLTKDCCYLLPDRLNSVVAYSNFTTTTSSNVSNY
jgi:hypothetical protein